MVTKLTLCATVAFLVLCFANVAFADTYYPLVKKGQIANPTVFAKRIQSSLEADPSGDTLVDGANVSPNCLLEAVNDAGANVESVDDLPRYLSSLTKGDMSKDQNRLYRLSRTTVNGGKCKMDLTTGTTRIAFPEEVAWFDANTGKMILAGECSNTPLSKKNAVKKIAWRKARVIQPRNVCLGKSIDLHVWEPAAAEVCIMQKDGTNLCVYDLIGVRPFPEGSNETRYRSNVSAIFGGTFRKMHKEGTLKLSEKPHNFLAVVNRGEEEYVIVEEVVVGKKLMSVPEFQDGDRVIVFFEDLTAFPSYWGLYSELEFCTSALHAIEGVGTDRVAQAK